MISGHMRLFFFISLYWTSFALEKFLGIAWYGYGGSYLTYYVYISLRFKAVFLFLSLM